MSSIHNNMYVCERLAFGVNCVVTFLSSRTSSRAKLSRGDDIVQFLTYKLATANGVRQLKYEFIQIANDDVDQILI